MIARFEEFVRTDAPHLRAAHNKMVVEALPVAAVEPELPATNVQFCAIDDPGCEACQ